MRLYASASLGGAEAGDIAVEATLSALFNAYLQESTDRVILFSLLDLDVRSKASLTASDREELLKHIAGFDQSESASIVAWENPLPMMRSAG